jgi:hypothetical protein
MASFEAPIYCISYSSSRRARVISHEKAASFSGASDRAAVRREVRFGDHQIVSVRSGAADRRAARRSLVKPAAVPGALSEKDIHTWLVPSLAPACPNRRLFASSPRAPLSRRGLLLFAFRPCVFYVPLCLTDFCSPQSSILRRRIMTVVRCSNRESDAGCMNATAVAPARSRRHRVPVYTREAGKQLRSSPLICAQRLGHVSRMSASVPSGTLLARRCGA